MLLEKLFDITESQLTLSKPIYTEIKANKKETSQTKEI